VKLENTCNFMAYFKIKKIVIKKIQTKCEGKINGRGCSKILHGWCKFQGGERERRRKNKNGLRRQTGSALPTHVHHRIEGVEIFRTLP